MFEVYRQGDILFRAVPVEQAQGRTMKRKNKRIVIAEGEVTGHAHAVEMPRVKMIEGTLSRFLVSPTPFEIVHEEHDTVQMPAGAYEIVQQREYTPQEIRFVAD